jgi:hypothetical protein
LLHSFPTRRSSDLRIKKIRSYLGDEDFCCTYGDGLSDVDIRASIAFHKKHGKLVTITAIQPPGRYGALQIENGTVQSFSTGINWRSQPHLNLRLNAQYNDIQLPGMYGSTKLFLVAPRIEYNFNTKLFWTTFIQYNTQSNNFNINSRLQYRYKPMSDFFLVYTDNYFTDPLFKNKNRALIFKLSYWF